MAIDAINCDDIGVVKMGNWEDGMIDNKHKYRVS